MLLERLLDGLDVRVTPFAVCAVDADQWLDLGRQPAPMLHFVMAGRGTFHLGDGLEVAAEAMTVVIVPRGLRQRMACGRGTAQVEKSARTCRELEGAGPARPDEPLRRRAGFRVACAEIQATFHATRGLFDMLHEPLVEHLSPRDPVGQSLAMLVGELARPQPGTRALADMLLKQALIFLLRRYCAGGECRLAWLSALDDERLTRALDAMLRRPAAAHTLDSLAALAGMSRSAFAEHFGAAFGRGPIDFLKEIRLREAARLLQASNLPIKALAGRVGYASRSYFSRAFKHFHGVPPRLYRASLAAAGGPEMV